jgi:hypothetical protein
MKIAANHTPTADYTIWLRRMSKDKRLLATHISLYTALFVCWQRLGFSKIASVATYHKCIKELDEFGYIHYQPSYHPKLGSQVYWPDALI